LQVVDADGGLHCAWISSGTLERPPDFGDFDRVTQNTGRLSTLAPRCPRRAYRGGPFKANNSEVLREAKDICSTCSDPARRRPGPVLISIVECCMKWRAAGIGGRRYDLSHLHPFSFDFVVPARDGKPEQRYGIDVIFSLHCFSRGIRQGEVYVADLAYADSREVRLFDEQRYTHSLQLPGIIRSIGVRRCFHTGYGNFFTVELIDAKGERVEYTVYFKLSRAPGRESQFDSPLLLTTWRWGG
jgi:hypothetical protein